MNSLYLFGLLLGTIATLFTLQITAQNDETNLIKAPNLYNMHEEIQEEIAAQIGRELHASISYLAMASYFGQDDVSLLGFKKFFMENSGEEKEHAEKLVEYLNSRNGRLTSINVKMPVTYTGTSGLQGLKDALSMEKEVSKHLMVLHQRATSGKFKDVHLADALESDLLREQVESMRQLEGLISKLTRMANENNAHLAEYLFDRQLLETSK